MPESTLNGSSLAGKAFLGSEEYDTLLFVRTMFYDAYKGDVES